MLDLYGGQQWWTVLGQAGADNVVMLQGVSLAEANEFVDILYGRQNILSVISSDKHFTVTEDTGFTVEDILNSNSEGGMLNWSHVRSMTKFDVMHVIKFSTVRTT